MYSIDPQVRKIDLQMEQEICFHDREAAMPGSLHWGEPAGQDLSQRSGGCATQLPSSLGLT